MAAPDLVAAALEAMAPAATAVATAAAEGTTEMTTVTAAEAMVIGGAPGRLAMVALVAAAVRSPASVAATATADPLV